MDISLQSWGDREGGFIGAAISEATGLSRKALAF